MFEPTLHHLPLSHGPAKGVPAGHARRLAWWSWNQTGQTVPHRVVVCVHGLTRQARDFDALAQALCPHAWVVSVDVAGRGRSDWLADPMAYAVPTYAQDLAALIAHLHSVHGQAHGAGARLAVDWVGTSMGGLIGMALACLPHMTFDHLILNDVGPVLQPQALARIGDYVGHCPVFATEAEAFAHLQRLCQSFGPHTPAQWADLSRAMLRPVTGGWTLHYDPAIAQPFKAMAALNADTPEAAALRAQTEAAMWAMYDAIAAPTLLVRGAQSDLISEATASAMASRGPRAHIYTVDGVGHAPTLVQPAQIERLQAFLGLGA